VAVGPGVRLRDLQREVAGHGLYYPPVPTYQEAMVGGTVATNAGGAATFKYGVTRDWVSGLRVLLFNGELLELERGQVRVRPGETIVVRLADGGRLEVQAPAYRLPALKKISAGYHASDPLDLIDLFIGSEGTLGLITGVTLRLAARPAAVAMGLAWARSSFASLALAAALREAAERARSTADAAGPDIRAIEWIDGPGLEILRAHGDAARLRVALPPDARAALLFETELDRPTDDAAAHEQLAAVLDGAGDTGRPLERLFRILAQHGALEDLELAFPEDARRHRALTELREALPRRVGEILAGRRRERPGVQKVGGDVIVPFQHVGEMIGHIEEAFGRRKLEHVCWGHLADGNLHPNALARDAVEVERGFAALLELGVAAASLGGCPLSEHGVGRNPIKQQLLRRFLGPEAIESMRRVKRALDPHGRFAPGVLFPSA
jgi:D-lactate dehydrogenase (cytochrome)